MQLWQAKTDQGLERSSPETSSGQESHLCRSLSPPALTCYQSCRLLALHHPGTWLESCCSTGQLLQDKVRLVVPRLTCSFPHPRSCGRCSR